MENISEMSNDKKSAAKSKSLNISPLKKLKNEPVKRKSFNLNEAVRSLDAALGRLKKSKLVNGDMDSNPQHLNPVRQGRDMFIGSLTSLTPLTDIESLSLISMNFSHYELMRNLSRSNCNLDGAFSSTNCGTFSSLSDIASREEQLERYFRSVDMWRHHREAGTSDSQEDLPEK